MPPNAVWLTFCTTATPLKRIRVGNKSAVTNAKVPLTSAPAHAARARHVHERHRPAWQLELELFFARHGAIRGVLIVLVFAAVSGFAVFIDLSAFDPFGPGLGWSPGLVIVAFLAAYVLNRSHSEE